MKWTRLDVLEKFRWIKIQLRFERLGNRDGDSNCDGDGCKEKRHSIYLFVYLPKMRRDTMCKHPLLRQRVTYLTSPCRSTQAELGAHPIYMCVILGKLVDCKRKCLLCFFVLMGLGFGGLGRVRLTTGWNGMPPTNEARGGNLRSG